MGKKRYTVAITGGSGAAYGRRLLEVLASTGATVHLVMSEAGAKVFHHEMGIELDLSDGDSVIRTLLGETLPNVEYHHYKNLEVSIASGSYKTEGMVICPCSMGTIGRVAGGISSNLVERAADVCLKERRQLILVPRETPLSEIHLENMLRLTRAGAMILPACPGFYHQPRRMEDLVDQVCAKVMDVCGISQEKISRWQGSE